MSIQINWQSLSAAAVNVLHTSETLFTCASTSDWRQVPCFRVSHPPQIVLPIQNWEPEEEPRKEEGVGPLVEHVYEVVIVSVEAAFSFCSYALC